MTVTAWTENLKTEEDKQKFLGGLYRARHIIERLLELMDKDDKSKTQAELSPRVYDNHNWHYLQAHANGYRQCLREYRKLLTLDHEELNGRKPAGR